MTLFSLILNLLTHYFHKILDPIGSKFVSRAEPRYRIFDDAIHYNGGIVKKKNIMPINDTLI